MKTRRRYFVGLLIPLALLGCVLFKQFANRDSAPASVLFVGNSYTNVGNLPRVVAAMAESRGIALACQKSTAGGATLENHWKGEKALKTVRTIADGAFDFVVFQEQSLRPVVEPNEMKEFAARLCEEARAAGARPMFYLTWAREKQPEMQAALNACYFAAAKTNDALVAPVGLAWQRARRLRPALGLYRKDGSHPAKLGVYLTACVFFGVLTGQTPVGVPHSLDSIDANGTRAEIIHIEKQDAAFCQRVAADTIKAFRESAGK